MESINRVLTASITPMDMSADKPSGCCCNPRLRCPRCLPKTFSLHLIFQTYPSIRIFLQTAISDGWVCQSDSRDNYLLQLTFSIETMSLPSISNLSTQPSREQSCKRNLGVFTLHILPNQYIIQPHVDYTKFKNQISVNRSTGKISISTEVLKRQSFQKSASYSLFLGVLPIFNKKFLVFVENVREVCVIDKAIVYEIQSLGYVSLGSEKDSQDQRWSTILSYMSFLNLNLMSQGYYFSFDYDLSISKIRYAEGYPFNFKYCWNGHIGSHLIEFGWFVPTIQGYVGSFSIQIKNSYLDYYLISRRSWKKGGTRYNSRGVGRKGNVANFCETEQIVYYNDYCCSHVQIRGSVPTFWKQTGVYATVEFSQSKQQNLAAFNNHFMKLSNQYNMIVCVNLLAKSKPEQHQLTLYFEEMIKQSSSTDSVKYQYFDFHQVCKNQRFDRAALILDKLGGLNEMFGFYGQNLQTGEVVQTQKGVMRTNCLDCLDRTNFVQSKLAMHIFDRILKSLDVSIQKDIGYKDLESAFDDLTSTKDFIIELRNIWANNGDMISIHYTGTPSTHTNILRTGKRDFAGSVAHTFVSINRFYIQNMTDNFKQQAIDILVGEHVLTANYNQLENRLKSVYQVIDEQEDEPLSK